MFIAQTYIRPYPSSQLPHITIDNTLIPLPSKPNISIEWLSMVQSIY